MKRDINKALIEVQELIVRQLAQPLLGFQSVVLPEAVVHNLAAHIVVCLDEFGVEEEN